MDVGQVHVWCRVTSFFVSLSLSVVVSGSLCLMITWMMSVLLGPNLCSFCLVFGPLRCSLVSWAMSFSLSINQSLFLVFPIVVVDVSCPLLVYRPGCRVCAIKLVHQSRCAIDATPSLPRDIRMWVVVLSSCDSSKLSLFFHSPFLSYWLTFIRLLNTQSANIDHHV